MHTNGCCIQPTTCTYKYKFSFNVTRFIHACFTKNHGLQDTYQWHFNKHLLCYEMKWLPKHALPLCHLWWTFVVTTIILFPHLTEHIAITAWGCTTAVHPPKIPIFLKLRSTHHGLDCSLQCLNFMPLPIRIPFIKELGCLITKAILHICYEEVAFLQQVIHLSYYLMAWRADSKMVRWKLLSMQSNVSTLADLWHTRATVLQTVFLWRL